MNTTLPPRRLEAFDSLCIRLAVGEREKEKALHLLQNFFLSYNSETENELIWFVCSLYVVSTLDRSTNLGIPLSHLLREANLRLYDFFGPLTTFCKTLGLDEKLVERLQVKYVVVTLIFQKYHQLCAKLFNMDFVSFLKRPSPTTSSLEQIFRFGWLVFLLCKGRLLYSSNGDFVQCLHLLLCVVNLLYLQVPVTIRKISPEGLPSLVEQPDIDPNINTLHILCLMNHAHYDQVKVLNDKFISWYNSLSCQSLAVDQILKLERLFSDIKSINCEYEVLLYECCDFDERLFLEGHQQLQSPARPPLIKDIVQMTPAKAALSCNNWLVNTLGSLSEEPNDDLKLFFKSGNKDMTQSVIQSVTIYRKLITFETDNIERKSLVIKLYYRFLLSILKSEAERLNTMNFDSLLANDLFNRSIFACALEVIIFTYRENMMKFPWILTKFNISAFEFYRIIECVVKNEPEFPRSVRNHLIGLEERIIEEIVWQADSPVFTGMDSEQRKILLERLTTNTITHASPTKAPTNHSHHKKIQFLLRKVLHLSTLRITDLCKELSTDGISLSSALVQQIERALLYVLTQTNLIQNRHLDQLILCVMFCVCNVNHVKIEFTVLMQKYLNQPQSNIPTLKNVLIEHQKYEDIIQFYNIIFIKTVNPFINVFEAEKSYIDKMDTSTTSLPPIESVPIPLTYHQKSPFRKLFISPLRTPLLVREQQPNNVLYSGNLKTPRSNFDRINCAVNSMATKAKRKLDYNLFQGEETIVNRVGNLLKENTVPSWNIENNNLNSLNPNIIITPSPDVPLKRKQQEGDLPQNEELKKPKF